MHYDLNAFERYQDTEDKSNRLLSMFKLDLMGLPNDFRPLRQITLSSDRSFPSPGFLARIPFRGRIGVAGRKARLPCQETPHFQQARWPQEAVPQLCSGLGANLI